jgi:3-oxoacyl-[acyl-carrier protein] reductase
MLINLTDKSAVVCGASQGIGRASAEELAQLGAAVTLVARDERRLEEVCRSLDTSRNQRHGWLTADFSDLEEVRRLAEQLGSHATGHHILVNNTGGPPPGPAINAGVNEFLQAFNNHLVANQLLVQSLAPGMRRLGYGRIINIISTSVKQPIAGLGVSNTVRGAVASWAKTLSAELGPAGITVNNILPGFTETERLRSLIDGRARAAQRTYDEIAASMMAEVPLGRFAQPSEIAAAVAFLASPAASYINGVSLAVDGGRTSCL